MRNKLMEVIADYNKDFYAWLMKNADLLRQHKFNEVDIEHVAEELESMGKSEKRELTSRLTVLLAHLLKWKFQPALRSISSISWKNTILTQRIDIKELLEDSPSLHYELGERLAIAYEKARLSAEDETGIDKKKFSRILSFYFRAIAK